MNSQANSEEVKMLDLDNVTEAVSHPDDKWLALTVALGLMLMVGTAVVAI